MKSFWSLIRNVLIFSALLTITAFAANSNVAETYTGEDYVSVYLRGMEKEAEAKAQIGTSAAEVMEMKVLKESSASVKTLIMIDNSVSIKKAQQEKISALVQDMIGGSEEKEQIAIATFGEGINYLTEYSSDYGELKQALSGITYEDQETYLTDVLYNVLTEEIQKDQEENFYRVVIISDGVDNKPVGITKEELYQELQENVIPVYTVGCQGKKNEEELESMFALSRITGAKSFVLDEIENTLDVVNSLAEDWEILHIQVKPEAVDMDGSRKAVKISIGEESIQIEMRMPQQELVVEEPVEEEPEPEVIVPEETMEEPIVEPEPEKTSVVPIAVIGGLTAVAFIIIMIAVILIANRKKKQRASIGFETYTDVQQNADSDGSTVLLGGNQRTYDLILEDISNPARVFQIPVSESGVIIIGRKKESCDICIDYERSISGRHCQIGVRNDRFYVRDLQSSNGTFLNENRVITDSELIAGNILRLGALRLRVSIH